MQAVKTAADAYVASTYASAAVCPQATSPGRSRPSSSHRILVDAEDLLAPLEQTYAAVANEAVAPAVDVVFVSVMEKDMTEARATQHHGASVLDSIATPPLDAEMSAQERLLLQQVEEMARKNAARHAAPHIVASQEESQASSLGTPVVRSMSRSPSGGSRELMPPPMFPHGDEKKHKTKRSVSPKRNPPVLDGIGKRLLPEPPVTFSKTSHLEPCSMGMCYVTDL